ncbi:unnamed protein product [Allacma fusca]|uniref:Uncharacterized protein n=1 Tax=Allacma fusca TaxID=39272 RepID=A0A8J2KWI5_9HEXA|nr:unnamed protein product [Allacma fusca]
MIIWRELFGATKEVHLSGGRHSPDPRRIYCTSTFHQRQVLPKVSQQMIIDIERSQGRDQFFIQDPSSLS